MTLRGSLPAGAVRTALFLALLSSGVLVAIRAALWGGPPGEMSALSTFSTFGYAAVGCTYLIQHARQSQRRMLLEWSGLSAVLYAGAAFIGQTTVVVLAKAALVAFGVAGASGYVREILGTGSRSERLTRIAAFRDALIIPLASAQITYLLWPNVLLNPVYDAYIHHFERILNIVVEPAVQVWYRSLDPWTAVATIAYLALPIAMSVTAIGQPTDALRSRVLTAMVATGGIGFLLYLICPAVGPFQSQEGAPGRLPDLDVIVPGPLIVPGRVPRNGMPSLHVAWILLILMNARPAGRGLRLAALAFAALNLAAAIGRYQHWLMDFVVAAPLAVSLQLAIVGHANGLASRRWGGALACMLLTLVWLIGFRAGLFTSLTAWQAWLVVTVTLLMPLLARRAGGTTLRAG